MNYDFILECNVTIAVRTFKLKKQIRFFFYPKDERTCKSINIAINIMQNFNKE